MTAPSFAFAPPPAPDPGPPPVPPGSAAAGSSSPQPKRTRARHLVADLVAVALVLGAVALSAIAWNSIFADLGFVAPMLGTSLAVAAFVLVAVRRGWSRPASFLVASALAIIGLALHHGSDIAELPSNLVEGWKALASTGLLIPTDSRLIVAPTVVASFATWVACESVVRRRSSAPALLALLVLHGITAAYTISQWQPSWWFAAALAACLGFLLAVSGLTRPGGASFEDDWADVSPRQIGSTVAVVGVLAAVAAGLMAVLGGSTDRAFDLRQELVSPLDITEAATPLARVKAGLVDTADSTVFTVSTDGLGPDGEITLIPVAVLDRYDGSIWSTSARFEVAGSRLPAPALANPSAGDASVAVELTDQYPFRFLPQVGVLRQIESGDIAWDPVTGTVASVDPDARSYRAVVSPISAGELPEALGDDEYSLDGVSDRPELTEEQRLAINNYLAEVVSVDDDPLDQLRAIQADLLSDRFGYNEQAPAGHSLAALVSYLWPSSAAGEERGDQMVAGRVGFSEHAASSFAVLSRELGVPSRVVVGYLLTEPITAENPDVLVSKNMIHAWPEVWIDGTGWIRLDVTNKVNESEEEPDRTPAVSASGVEANATDLPDVEEPVILPDDRLESERSDLWYLLALPLVPLLYVGLVGGAKALRRAQRKRSSADRRIAGAWRETQDRFGELGLPASPSLSVLDVVDSLDEIDLREVSEPLVELAPRLDTALYAPTPATDAEADRAWELARSAIGEARRASSPTNRIRAALDPRPLLRR